MNAGACVVQLPRPLPAGDYAVELTVTSGPQITSHKLGITTRRILPWREARAAIRRALDDDISGDGGGGVYYIAKACRRAGPRRIVCDYIQAEYGDAGTAERCAGKISAHLRPDGLQVLRKTARRAKCARQ